MPFTPRTPRLFNARSIWANTPRSSGVYGISNAAEWIVIGEADNLCDTLMRLLQESDGALHAHHPTGFDFEVCDAEQRKRRLRRLVAEYHPTLEERFG